MIATRILRRRWVLAVIFIFSLIYFVVKTYSNAPQVEHYVEQSPPLKPLLPDNLSWQTNNGNETNDKVKSCRNSVQGKELIADEIGYICTLDHVVAGGCCDTSVSETRRYICDSCLTSGCCSVYEHCVSCCLQPEKQPLLRAILSKASGSFQQLFASVTDQFELCLTKCRTSSQSVQHENSYRDPDAKFCYGDHQPDIQPAS